MSRTLRGHSSVGASGLDTPFPRPRAPRRGCLRIVRLGADSTAVKRIVMRAWMGAHGVSEAAGCQAQAGSASEALVLDAQRKKSK